MLIYIVYLQLILPSNFCNNLIFIIYVSLFIFISYHKPTTKVQSRKLLTLHYERFENILPPELLKKQTIVLPAKL